MKLFGYTGRLVGRMSLLVVLSFAALTVLCGWAGSCGTALHKASVAANSIAASLHTTANLNHSLQASGQISLEERQQLATLIDQATQGNDAFIGQLQTAEANRGAVTTATILQAFDKLTTQLDGLEKDGVLHLKSADAQKQFEVWIGAIKLQQTVLRALIGSSNSQNNVPPRSPQSGSALLFAALALTPEEIAALLTLITSIVGEGSALVQKLLAMKGEADAELLTNALAEDAAARKQAQADEGAV